MTEQIFQASNLISQSRRAKHCKSQSLADLNGSVVSIQLQIAVNFQQKYLHRQTMAAKWAK